MVTINKAFKIAVGLTLIAIAIFNIKNITDLAEFVDNAVDVVYSSTYAGMRPDECPPGHAYVHDRTSNITDAATTTTTTERGRSDGDDDGRRIPKTIHFVVRSRCLPVEIVSRIDAWSTLLVDHSVRFHDGGDVDDLVADLSSSSGQGGGPFRYVASVYGCLSNREARRDLARLVVLWRYGGVVADVDAVPGPGLANAVGDDDECVFEVYGGDADGTDESSIALDPRFAACRAEHPAVFAAVTRFVGTAGLVDRCHAGSCDYSPTGYYGRDLNIFYKTRQRDGVRTYRNSLGGFPQSSIVLLHSDRTSPGEHIFAPVVGPDDTAVKYDVLVDVLPEDEHRARCANVLSNDSYRTDVASLLRVVGVHATGTKEGRLQNETTNSSLSSSLSCPDGLEHVPNLFDPAGVNVEGRKIPKIIHMTSKSACFTPVFARNVRKWHFGNGHSFLLHDDAAVDRLLLDREWPEFPLLKEIQGCLPKAAAKADLWRYVALWEYGGVYTDIDNAPGSKFANGTVIEDHMDAFLEQEQGGFPSQYFLAASPHHPVMFFMVISTIERLLDVNNVGKQYIPFTTGPGATKVGVIKTIGGNGYPKAGEYAGVNGRDVTIVGSPRAAKQRLYVWRNSVAKNPNTLGLMNMTHYSQTPRTNKPYTCVYEIWKSTGRS